MYSTTLRRAFTQPSISTSSLPPTFLLPLRARLSTITTTTNTTDPEPPSTAYHAFRHRNKPSANPESQPTTPQLSSPPSPPPPTSILQKQAPPTPSPLLPLLAAQPPYYITAHLHARPYLLTTGDALRLPFLMPNVVPGTVLRITRASSIGSRDYTYRGDPWVDERFFVCRVRVVGAEGEPMRVVEKTKRRQRHVKKAKSKMRFTVLRVVEVGVKPDGDAGEAAVREEEHEEA